VNWNSYNAFMAGLNKGSHLVLVVVVLAILMVFALAMGRRGRGRRPS
jgi:hypothetical protein